MEEGCSQPWAGGEYFDDKIFRKSIQQSIQQLQDINLESSNPHTRRMYHTMAPPNPRKRPAPGSSPAIQTPQMQPQAYNNAASQQLANADFLRGWNGQAAGADQSQEYADPGGYNMNNVFGGGVSTPSYENSPATHSTQLARRPHNNRQLVATGQRLGYDNSAWGQFGDDAMLEQQNGHGGVEENDNIELLEEKAAVAKRDAQSKRKQIPPFVQKLSRYAVFLITWNCLLMFVCYTVFLMSRRIRNLFAGRIEAIPLWCWTKMSSRRL